MKKNFVLILLLGIPAFLYGQSCEEILRQANTEFDQGHFVGVPKMLEQCLAHGFTEEQKSRAYKLITQVYLLLGYQKEADESYLKLLKANPEFVPTIKDDPIDMVYLSRKFTSTPVIEPCIRGGATTTYPTFQEDMNLNPYNKNSQRLFNLGTEISLGAGWNLSDRWALGAETVFAYRVVRTLFTRVSGDDQIKASERMFWIDIPGYIKYTLNRSKNQPYVLAGIQGNFLLSSNTFITGIDNTEGGGGGEVAGSSTGVTKSRNRINYSAVAGAGVRMKRGRSYWLISLRVTVGLSPVVNPQQNYYSSDNPSELSANITQYRWLSSCYRLNYASLSVGYVFPKYQPRMIKDNFFARMLWGKKHNLPKEKKPLNENP